MAEVIHKLNQAAEGQLRLEAQTSRMDALHKIPELMQKVEHVAQGLERLNAHSNHGDVLHAIPALKRATSVQASLAHAPPSRVGKQVESAPSGDRTSNRARSRVTHSSDVVVVTLPRLRSATNIKSHLGIVDRCLDLSLPSLQ